MGLLKFGIPQKWEESKRNLRYVRMAGVRQFISTYERAKNLKVDELLWGDEIEYGIFRLDRDNKKIRLSLRAKEVMDRLNQKEESQRHKIEGCNWLPEYGAWMIEATPNRPYTGYVNDLLRVERNMRLRRQRLLTVLQDDEVAPTFTTFPLLGTLKDDGTVPPTSTGGPRTESEYIGDNIINSHPRFGALTENIRCRRGGKVNIMVPLFQDINTPEYIDIPPSMKSYIYFSTDKLPLWRYGRADISVEKHGKNYIEMGPYSSSCNDKFEESSTLLVTLQKWLVNVRCKGCCGLYYRSAPSVIVPGANWHRNGDILFGTEIPNIPGWIKLQNGYYLPTQSDNGKIKFLQKLPNIALELNADKNLLVSNTPTLLKESKIENRTFKRYVISSILKNQPNALPCTDRGLSLKCFAEPTIKTTEKPLNCVIPSIHMDAMAFGMGCCCLQITFQANDLNESRFIYDQLGVLAPIMMALTASTPIVKGRLSGIDCRWGVISESVDDRTLEERGKGLGTISQPALVGKGKRRIYKSRYDSISTFIHQGSNTSGKMAMKNSLLNMYNDIPVPIDEESYSQLILAGVDPALSQHIAHLFTRDPMVIFNGAVEEIDDRTHTEHFESIQSTNWQTVRWKPPPPHNSSDGSNIGWRTEFRSMEVQLTDFENAAFTVFIVLLTRVILAFDLNLYIPISRVDTNMQRAHTCNSAADGKFFFRRHMTPLQKRDDGCIFKYTSMCTKATSGGPSSITKVEIGTGVITQQSRNAPVTPGDSEENSYEEMTMSQIMIGKGDYFPGLISLVRAYVDYINCDITAYENLNNYLKFIEMRAKGKLFTTATWIRRFVQTHPHYRGDSVVTDEIAYDIITACKEIGDGTRHEPDLLGDVRINLLEKDGAYDVKLEASKVQNDRLLELLRRYTNCTSFSDVIKTRFE